MKTTSQPVIRSAHLQASEISWFAPICNGDYRYLGVPDGDLRSSFENASGILLEAEKQGFRNILCPSSWQVGQDTLSFASAVAPMTSKINLLAAVRCGEVHPVMLARTLSTLDHILQGRLTINIISSDLPGEKLDSAARYQKSREVIEILKQIWTQDSLDFKGQFYNLQLSDTSPGKPYQSPGPLLYFGGYSPAAQKLCAEHCDVYLMWPETRQKLSGMIAQMSAYAAEFDRSMDFGLRVHVIVRETEAEAREAARSLVSRLDPEEGKAIRERALDAKSLGVAKQSALRDLADADEFVDELLFTGIGRGRSGCGAALCGTPEQILERISEYEKMGMRAFIFSGYPHKEECEAFGKLLMPHLKTCSLPREQERIPKEPKTPLSGGERR